MAAQFTSYSKRINSVLGMLLTFLLFANSTSAQNWMQKGNEIIGDSIYELFGWSVDLSADGKTMVIGSQYNDLNGLDAGLTRIMKWEDTAWVQVGADILGLAAGDHEGYSVAINGDGSTIATAATASDSINSDAGQIRVFEWSGTTWVQKGSSFFGSSVYDSFGHSIQINNDGTMIAAGSPNNSSGGYRAGLVKVFKWDGSNWSQMGSDILGESTQNYSGFALSLSSADSILAIGAYYNSDNGVQAGQVRVFEWTGTAWSQMGSDIDGAAVGDNFGVSVALSSDGSSFVAGGYKCDSVYNNIGGLRVFDWSGTAWVQRGNTLYGDWPDDNFGTTVSMSADGNTIAGGAPPGQATIYSSPSPGYTKVFNWSTAWTQSGATFYGLVHGDQNGRAISLSSNGKIIAMGEPYSDPQGISAAGRVRVFFTCDTSFSSFSETACFQYELPSGKAIVLTSGTYEDTIMNATGCDSIITISVTINTVDTSVVKTGITLTSQAQNATYNWLDCANGFAEITGETNQAFIPAVNGNYAVEVTQNGCVDTSGCFSISNIGLLENKLQNLSIFPNPTNGELNFRSGDLVPLESLLVFNVLGEVVLRHEFDNAHEACVFIPGSPGLYILQLNLAEGEQVLAKVYKY